MKPDQRDLRHSFLSTLALITLLATASCGGGDGGGGSSAPPSGSTPPPTTTTPPAATSTDFVLGGVLDSSPAMPAVGGTPHLYKLLIVDPLSPSTPVVADDLGTASLVGSELLPSYTSSYTTDREARSASYNGAPLMLYVKGGKIWSIDLRVGPTHVPRQVSSLSNVCSGLGRGGRLFQVGPDGIDAWVRVTTCTGAPYFVRSTMGPSDVPLDLGNANLIEILDDGAMNALGFLVLDSQDLSFYSRDMVRLGPVSGAAAIRQPPLNGVRDHVAVQSIYYRFGNALRRLNWTAAGANLDDPVYMFSNAEAFALWAGDLDAMYLSDGPTLMKLSSGGSPTVMAMLTGPNIVGLFLTDSRLVIQQSNRDLAPAQGIASIRKSGGPVTPIASGTGTGIQGVTGSAVYYTSADATRHLAMADGSADVPAMGGIVYRRSRTADRRDIESTSRCEPLSAADTSCSNGNLISQPLDIPLPPTVFHGSVTHTATYRNGFLGSAEQFDVIRTTTGVPEFLSYFIASDASGQSVNRRDLYVWTPGMPNSLARVTQNIP